MKLGLGTAQFGLDYGISNQHGKVSDDELSKIFSFCKSKNINLIDTAQIYGDSEKRISKYLNDNYRIITKFTLDSINKKNSLIDCLNASINNLKTNKIDTFMVHSFNLNSSKQLDDIYKDLMHFKLSGAVNKIGVSVYNENEIDYILDNYQFDVIQLPLNIFDQKLELNGILKKIKLRNLEIHVRSVFLQGLCFMEPDYLVGKLKEAKPNLELFRKYSKELNTSLQELALSYLLNIKDIDAIIIGCTTKKELFENYRIITNFKPFNINYKPLNFRNKNIVNPMNWSQ